MGGGHGLKMSSYVVDEHKRVTRQLGERLKIGSCDQRITTRPQQTEDRRAHAGLGDLVAFASRNADVHLGRLPGDFGEHSGLSNTGVARNHHDPAASMVVGTAHHAQPGRQHIVSAAQRSVRPHSPSLSRDIADLRAPSNAWCGITHTHRSAWFTS